MIISFDKNLFAISFDTATYRVLSHFVKEHQGYSLTRIDPQEFLLKEKQPNGCFINLVIKDFNLRKKVSAYIDDNCLHRFSLIHPTSYADMASVGPGCLIFPSSVIYPTATLHKDVIVHSNSLIAEQCQIGKGVFVSGGVTISGSTVIGDYCQINGGVILYDNIAVVQNTVIGAGTVVRKDIPVSGTYTGLLKNKTRKIR
jgi:UDP-3-O-[3-hydroxymyristoyl] glucosamine N-acyltransferase